MDALINLANILYVIAYFTLDMLRLRLLTTTAAVCLAIYFYSQPVPMLNIVAWNLFFVALNLSQIARIVLIRHRKRLSRSCRLSLTSVTSTRDGEGDETGAKPSPRQANWGGYTF